MHKVIYIMGVSGCGKSTIGQLLSEKTGFSFYDGDDFHPKENIAKMSAGQALEDEDRWGWLEAINTFVKKEIQTQNVIIACSALKESYRKTLTTDLDDVQYLWVYLHGNFDLILKRIENRQGHFLPSKILYSQFDTLEPPTYGLHIDVAYSSESIIDQISSALVRD